MRNQASPSPSPSGSPWEMWLDEQSELFFLYARQQTRSEFDAKDVLQDALTEVWLKTEGAIPDKPLVFTTIRRRAIDLGRSITRRTAREENYADHQTSWFVPDYSTSDTHTYLAQAIQQLPQKLSEVIILKLWGDLTFPEISEMTNISVPTLTSRYRYALERLRHNKQLAELNS